MPDWKVIGEQKLLNEIKKESDKIGRSEALSKYSQGDREAIKRIERKWGK